MFIRTIVNPLFRIYILHSKSLTLAQTLDMPPCVPKTGEETIIDIKLAINSQFLAATVITKKTCTKVFKKRGRVSTRATFIVWQKQEIGGFDLHPVMLSKANGLVKYERVDSHLTSVPILVEESITVPTQRVVIGDFKGSIFQMWNIKNVRKKQLPQFIKKGF